MHKPGHIYSTQNLPNTSILPQSQIHHHAYWKSYKNDQAKVKSHFSKYFLQLFFKVKFM